MERGPVLRFDRQNGVDAVLQGEEGCVPLCVPSSIIEGLRAGAEGFVIPKSCEELLI